jgi:hypothetical protein
MLVCSFEGNRASPAPTWMLTDLKNRSDIRFCYLQSHFYHYFPGAQSKGLRARQIFSDDNENLQPIFV